MTIAISRRSKVSCLTSRFLCARPDLSDIDVAGEKFVSIMRASGVINRPRAWEGDFGQNAYECATVAQAWLVLCTARSTAPCIGPKGDEHLTTLTQLVKTRGAEIENEGYQYVLLVETIDQASISGTSGNGLSGKGLAGNGFIVSTSSVYLDGLGLPPSSGSSL